MNVIARLEYELAYYDSAVHRFNHYTTRTPSSLEEGSRFLVSPRRDQFGSTKCVKRNCVSLLTSKNLKLKKGKTFRSWTRESSVFPDSYMFMNILWTLCLFHVFISWSCIFGLGYVTFLFNVKFCLYSCTKWFEKWRFSATQNSFVSTPLNGFKFFLFFLNPTNKLISAIYSQWCGYKHWYLIVMIRMNTIYSFAQLNASKYCYITSLIQLCHTVKVSSTAIKH